MSLYSTYQYHVGDKYNIGNFLTVYHTYSSFLLMLNFMSKIEYLIGNVILISHYISLLVQNGS